MKNPFKSDDQDETRDAASDKKSDSAEYRDDPSLFSQSSDYAQRGTTNQYSGQSPGDESGNYASGRDSRGAHSGSQEQWRDPSAAQTAAAPTSQGDASSAAPSGDDQRAPAHDTSHDGEAYGDVQSRSADPGQSSYGGFTNEGPTDNDAAQQKASDRGKPASDEADSTN